MINVTRCVGCRNLDTVFPSHLYDSWMGQLKVGSQAALGSMNPKEKEILEHFHKKRVELKDRESKDVFFAHLDSTGERAVEEDCIMQGTWKVPWGLKPPPPAKIEEVDDPVTDPPSDGGCWHGASCAQRPPRRGSG